MSTLWRQARKPQREGRIAQGRMQGKKVAVPAWDRVRRPNAADADVEVPSPRRRARCTANGGAERAERVVAPRQQLRQGRLRGQRRRQRRRARLLKLA
eukprot:1773950-Pleurochrysis_carterae.AAC.1